MTAHELAKLLLDGPDVLVVAYQYYNGTFSYVETLDHGRMQDTFSHTGDWLKGENGTEIEAAILR